MLLVFLFTSGVDQNIVDENYHESIKERLKDSVHKIHECSWGISEPEQHYSKFIMTIPRYESRFVHVLRLNPQLTISRLQVDFRKYIGSL